MDIKCGFTTIVGPCPIPGKSGCTSCGIEMCVAHEDGEVCIGCNISRHMDRLNTQVQSVTKDGESTLPMRRELDTLRKFVEDKIAVFDRIDTAIAWNLAYQANPHIELPPEPSLDPSVELATS